MRIFWFFKVTPHLTELELMLLFVFLLSFISHNFRPPPDLSPLEFVFLVFVSSVLPPFFSPDKHYMLDFILPSNNRQPFAGYCFQKVSHKRNTFLCLGWVSFEIKRHSKLQHTVRVDVIACHLLVFSLYVSICMSVLIYLFSLFPCVCVCVCLIPFSCSILIIAFAERSLLRITTFSIVISLVNVTNILLSFCSKLLITARNRIERCNFLQCSVSILPTA